MTIKEYFHKKLKKNRRGDAYIERFFEMWENASICPQYFQSIHQKFVTGIGWMVEMRYDVIVEMIRGEK